MKKIKLPMEEPYRLLVITYFNLVFGNHKNSDRCVEWKIRIFFFPLSGYFSFLFCCYFYLLLFFLYFIYFFI
jgi:hypothetical protein